MSKCEEWRSLFINALIDYRYVGDQKHTSKYTSPEIQICEFNQ